MFNLKNIKTVGFIRNFDRKGSYPEFSNHIIPITSAVKIPVVAVKPVRTKEVSVIKIIEKRLLKRALSEFKASNPNHVEKLLASSKLV